MDVSKLQQGQVIKNYKEMCEILNEKIKTGKSRQLQLKNWERYFKWHKEGHKFIIDEIRDIPIEKVDERQFGGNSIYANDIQELILYVLYRQPTENVLWSCPRLLREVSMINNNYNVGRNNIAKLSEVINIEESFIYDFYNHAHNSLRSKLETALNILHRKSLISWQKVVTLCKEEVHIKMNEFGTPKIINGQVCYDTNEIYRKATEDEIKMILTTERNVMLEMDYKDKQDIFLNGKYQKFRKTVNERLQSSGNILYYYNAYEIIYNKEHIKQEIIGQIGKEIVENNLNNNIKNGLQNSAKIRHDNAILKIKNNNNKIKFNDKLKSSITFVKNNECLIDNLIDKKAKSLLSELYHSYKK